MAAEQGSFDGVFSTLPRPVEDRVSTREQFADVLALFQYGDGVIVGPDGAVTGKKAAKDALFALGADVLARFPLTAIVKELLS